MLVVLWSLLATPLITLKYLQQLGGSIVPLNLKNAHIEHIVNHLLNGRLMDLGEKRKKKKFLGVKIFMGGKEDGKR